MTPEPRRHPWKGLDTTRPPTFIGYTQAERMVAALLVPAARWRPDAVAGIARGGLVPATMAACSLAVPLALLAPDRAGGTAAWLGPAPSGRRLLLVDDCCATGRTMQTVRATLHRQGWEVLTMTVVHDPETTAYVPDLSHPMRELFRFPWERGESTPAARALRATGARADRSTEAEFIGLDLDGLLLALAPAALPIMAPERAVLISTRPDTEREPILARLAGLAPAPPLLHWAPPDLSPDPPARARYKAEAATRWGCTTFMECDPEQAIRIAALAPHLLVHWWSPADGRAWPIGAAPPSDVAPPAAASARIAAQARLAPEG